MVCILRKRLAIKKQIKYNLKNVHAAKLTLSDSGEYTYDTPKAIPGAVSISLDAEGESNPFYGYFKGGT